MKRRAFITLFGGAAAAAWPLAARAQQPGRMPLIAVLTGVSDDQTARTRSTAFVTRLQELGWTDGRNMRLELRWGRGDAEIIRRQATEVVALAPDVIVTTGGPATERMLQLTRSVPIVFAVVPDPVGSGLVARLSRPGGNATGFMQFEYSLSGKWLELLKQIAPSMTRTAVLRDAAITAGIGQFAVIQSGGAVGGRRGSTDQPYRRPRDGARRIGVFARGWRRPARDGERDRARASRDSLSRLRPGTNCQRSMPPATLS
jgi:putative tryptophan/tyrosine transport system substrate-binding protein